MRSKKRWAAFLLCAAMVLPAEVYAKELNTGREMMTTEEGQTQIGLEMTSQIEGNESDVLLYRAGETKNLLLNFTNTGNTPLTCVNVTPRVKANTDAWPFEIENKNYTQTVDAIAPGETKAVSYAFTARQDVVSRYYKLKFDLTCAEGTISEQSVFLKTDVKEENQNQQDPGQQKPNQQDQGSGEQNGSVSYPYDAGGVYNGGEVVSGGGETKTGVPRVIVSGFNTDPAEIPAGSNFNLIVHLQNTSQDTAVSNMLFEFNAPAEGAESSGAAPAFLPVSGSSSVYLDHIPAGGTKDIAIALNARADLLQKPYSIELSMKYQDGNATQYEGHAALAIPIKQAARFEFSEVEVSSPEIAVGDEANIMCNIYNLGRTKLYNVKAKFEGEGIKGKEVFVGHVESGSSAAIDGMVTGEKETTGDGRMKMIVTYEDEAGASYSTEQEFQLLVTPKQEDAGMVFNPETEPEKKGFPILPVGIAVVILAGGIAAIIIVKKKKQRKLQEEEESLADEFDRLTEDE